MAGRQRRICGKMAEYNIKKEPPADAKQWEGVPDKFAEHFSPNSGEGD